MSHVRDNIRHIPFIVLHPINPHHQLQPKVTSYFTSYKQHIIFYYNIPINIFIISMAGYFSLFKSCTTHLMSITTADQMRLYLCIIAFHRIVPDRLARVLLHFAYSATTSPHRIDRDHVFTASTTSSSHRLRLRLHRIDHVFIASTASTSSSHRPRPRLRRIDHDHVFVASTASTSSSHRPRLHRIDRVYVFIASTTSTSSSHRPRPRLHRIDRVYVFIASTATTSSSHRPWLHLHRIDHVFIASTASTSASTTTTSSSHRTRPRLHRIDHDHVFIALTASTSSSHRPCLRLHRIDRVHVSSLYGSASFWQPSHRLWLPSLHCSIQLPL